MSRKLRYTYLKRMVFIPKKKPCHYHIQCTKYELRFKSVKQSAIQTNKIYTLVSAVKQGKKAKKKNILN